MPAAQLEDTVRTRAVALVELDRQGGGSSGIDEPEDDLVGGGRDLDGRELRELSDRALGGHEAAGADRGERVVAEVDDIAEDLDDVAGRQRRAGVEDEVTVGVARARANSSEPLSRDHFNRSCAEAAAPVDLDAVQTVVAAGVAGEVGQRARIGRRRRRRDVDRELAARDRDVARTRDRAGRPPTAARRTAAASFTWPSSSVRAHVSVEPSASSRMPGSSTAVMWRSHVSRYATRRVPVRGRPGAARRAAPSAAGSPTGSRPPWGTPADGNWPPPRASATSPSTW